MYKFCIKRCIDIVVSSLLIIILLPLLLLLTIGLFIANQGKPFFYQLRPGKNGRIFKIIKFKTMNDKRDVNGSLLPDSERLTKMGAIIRKTSLDEIPQLFNVLIGNMSLIGPRPLLVEYITLYNSHQSRRHELRPGITGWAQVNGRNTITWQKKFEYDVWYVDNLSFLLDLKIIFLTMKKVIKSEGISSEGHVTSDIFQGNDK